MGKDKSCDQVAKGKKVEGRQRVGGERVMKRRMKEEKNYWM